MKDQAQSRWRGHSPNANLPDYPKMPSYNWLVWTGNPSQAHTCIWLLRLFWCFNLEDHWAAWTSGLLSPPILCPRPLWCFPSVSWGSPSPEQFRWPDQSDHNLKVSALSWNQNHRFSKFQVWDHEFWGNVWCSWVWAEGLMQPPSSGSPGEHCP